MADQIYKLQYNGRTLTYQGWNGHLAYEYIEPPPTNFTLLFSSDTPVSSGTLSENVSNFDEVMVCHGLSCSDTKTYSFNKVGILANVYNIVFDTTNNRFVRYVAHYNISGTSFSRSNNPECNYHGLSNGSWTNDGSSYRNGHIYEIWGIKYVQN